jgi:1,4-dihydroxy-6-naphthoate synthase
MHFRIGISPCPNDTFIFEAIHERLIDLHGHSFEFVFEDVETLNRLALRGDLDIAKISYANYFQVQSNYVLLRSGGALGKGVGPLLVAKQNFESSELKNKLIAIPGTHTTANFLLRFAFGGKLNIIEMPFHLIEDAVLKHKVDAGVIIHENRFTYHEKGLVCIKDLGTYWETETKLPIPLGCIALRRNFDEKVLLEINELIAKSIHVAYQNNQSLSSFITSHAQEMKESIMRNHIDLYVNEYSLDIGLDGAKAVYKMKEILDEANTSLPIFIHSK